MRLYVANFRYELTSGELRDLFKPYGGTEGRVLFDPHTGKSRGFGFVDVSDAEWQRAITELDGQQLDGRSLHVEVARPLRSEKGDVE